MRGLGAFRNVLVIVLLSLAVLPACSTQGPRQTQEQQHETAQRPARSESKAKENLETAGQATLVVLLLGIAAGVAALPALLIFLL